MLRIRVADRKQVILEPLSSDSEIQLRIQWLGQAGFLIDSKQARIIIDPYLSDSLAIKYKGTRFEHVRMMPVFINPADIGSISVFLSSHHHTDHMDKDTIYPIASTNKSCLFVIPAASCESPKLKNVAKERIIAADAFAPINIRDIAIFPIPSAHEELTIDESGHHVYLGYIITIGNITLYHSGDCVPYAGLLRNLADFRVDIALLPVNGRDEIRKTAGILGNFTLDEALQLSMDAGFGFSIGHHFGMFEFNTIDVGLAENIIQRKGVRNFMLAATGEIYEFF